MLFKWFLKDRFNERQQCDELMASGFQEFTEAGYVQPPAEKSHCRMGVDHLGTASHGGNSKSFKSCTFFKI